MHRMLLCRDRNWSLDCSGIWCLRDAHGEWLRPRRLGGGGGVRIISEDNDDDDSESIMQKAVLCRETNLSLDRTVETIVTS